MPYPIASNLTDTPNPQVNTLESGRIGMAMNISLSLKSVAFAAVVAAAGLGLRARLGRLERS
jgi:hypothetical protein